MDTKQSCPLEQMCKYTVTSLTNDSTTDMMYCLPADRKGVATAADELAMKRMAADQLDIEDDEFTIQHTCSASAPPAPLVAPHSVGGQTRVDGTVDNMAEVVRRNLTSSCPQGDISEVREMLEGECRYINGPYTDEHGNTRLSGDMRLPFRLGSCDRGDADKLQTDSDIRSLCYYRWGGDKHGMDRKHITFSARGIPFI